MSGHSKVYMVYMVHMVIHNFMPCEGGPAAGKCAILSWHFLRTTVLEERFFCENVNA